MAKKTTKGRAPAKNPRKSATGKGRKPAAKKKPAARKRPATAPKKKKTGGFPWSILLAAIITFIVGIILVIVLGDRLKVQIPDKAAREKPPIEKVIKGTRRVTLYFSSSDGKSLTPRRVKIAKGTVKAEATAIIKQLIGGSGKGSPQENPIPKGTKLLSLRISNNRATIDFSKELRENHPGGSSAELQTIYAIVNSITLNISEIKTVRILIGGRRQDTLAGHILISVPLSANKKIISK